MSGKKILYEIVDRRPGDIAECYADPLLAKNVIDWKAKYKLNRMCEDVWRWQKMNPITATSTVCRHEWKV